MVELKISANKTMLISKEDLDLVNQFKWSFSGHGYVHRKDSNGMTVYLHRFLLNAKKGEFVDHINRNKLDNRRENLRLASCSQNSANSVHRLSISGYRGVTWRPAKKRWVAQISYKDKKQYLGYFVSKVDAAIAYNKAAISYFGEFARLNNV